MEADVVELCARLNVASISSIKCFVELCTSCDGTIMRVIRMMIRKATTAKKIRKQEQLPEVRAAKVPYCGRRCNGRFTRPARASHVPGTYNSVRIKYSQLLAD